jgi:hypothetical protein
MSAASGHLDATKRVSAFNAASAAGLPTFTAVAKFSVRAPDAAMAVTALDDGDPRLGHQAQHLGGFGAHVLGAGVAGKMQADAAVDRLEAGRQPLLLGDVDDILRDIKGGLRKTLDRRVLGQDERPLECEHQGA